MYIFSSSPPLGSVYLKQYAFLATHNNHAPLPSHSAGLSDQWLSLLEDLELTLPTMSGSGFLSSEAEAALMGDEEARQLFYQQQMQNARRGSRNASSSSYQQHWSTAPGMNSTMAQTSAQAYGAPSQYPSWPTSSWGSLGPNDYAAGQYPSSAYSTPVVPSSPYATGSQYNSNAPWPALHPDDIDTTADSRSVSPNPADLHNFGYLLQDGRSWRCAYPNCTSQARFTRGCDLRKHYRRHSKELFCSYEDCPQSREGGFSSKKDLARHESKHNPRIHCSQKGCIRVFSRLDNMKDHVRRIHGKSS